MKFSSTTGFIAGLLLFFLPFVEIKCNSATLYEVKGIDLVTGFKIKDPTKRSAQIENTRVDVSNERQSGNTFAMIAFGLGIVGLILSFLNFKSQPMASMITGLLAAGCLIALLIDVKSGMGRWNNPSSAKHDPEGDLFNGLSDAVKIRAVFTIWYYLSVVSFLVAAFFSYKKGLPPLPAASTTTEVSNSETMA